MKVKWYLSEIWNSADDNTIYISMDNYELISWTKWRVWSAMVLVKEGYDVNLIAKQIKFELNKQETVREFAVITAQKANDLIWWMLQMIELFLISIAFISLIVWAVWITNTMYTSVLERTKQIWIMKAIWASKEIILSLFLIESWIIWLVGGIIWTALWISVALAVWIWASEAGFDWMFSIESIDYLWILSILLITFITWIISWALPAKQASKLQAAEALRYE